MSEIMLSLTSGAEFSYNPAIAKTLTLRNMCADYRDAGGREWRGAEPPELDGAIGIGRMCRMRSFTNVVGHVDSGTLIGFDAVNHGRNIESFRDDLVEAINVTLMNRRLWCPSGTDTFTRGARGWNRRGARVDTAISSFLDVASSVFRAPLSAYSPHAYYEAQRIPESSLLRKAFTYDSQVTPVTGLIGTLHNNTTIDVVLGEKDKVPSIELRSFRDEYLGFYCAGHTSHSEDAGVARRVTMDMRGRILDRRTVEILAEALSGAVGVAGGDDWRLMCMGKLVTVGASAIESIYRTLTRLEGGLIKVSLYTDTRHRVALLSISSGTLVKEASNGIRVDSCQHRLEYQAHYIVRSVLNMTGPDQLRAYFSPYFSLIPWVTSDRPPRPLMASVQTQQVVCTPWSPGTAAVSPCYVTHPMVRTKFLHRILANRGADVSSVADELPGLDASICYANMGANYEDAMIVSRDFVDRGGFSSLSICHYLLPGDEHVSPVGTIVCSKLCRWWKSGCNEQCSHNEDELLIKAEGEDPARRKRRRIVCTSQRHPTGMINSIALTDNGELSVTVLSYAQLQSGDKLSMGHGQKGVAIVMPSIDIPFGMDDNQGQINFDIIMSISSVVNRQTNGLIHETMAATDGLKNWKFMINNPGQYPELTEGTLLMNPITGEHMTTVMEDGSVRDTTVTCGFTRVFAQTQMVRERQHSSHSDPQQRTINTPVGRSKGGAVKLGEMEIQALVSSGMKGCLSELTRRGNMIVQKVCVSCRRLMPLCPCVISSGYVAMEIPHGTVVLDYTMACTEGVCMEYDVSPVI